MEEILNGLKQIKTRVDSGTITTVNGTETLLSKQLESMLEKAINYKHSCTELQAIEELKDFAYNNCQLHNTDQLEEIIERL